MSSPSKLNNIFVLTYRPAMKRPPILQFYINIIRFRCDNKRRLSDRNPTISMISNLSVSFGKLPFGRTWAGPWPKIMQPVQLKVLSELLDGLAIIGTYSPLPQTVFYSYPYTKLPLFIGRCPGISGRYLRLAISQKKWERLHDRISSPQRAQRPAAFRNGQDSNGISQNLPHPSRRRISSILFLQVESLLCDRSVQCLVCQ